MILASRMQGPVFWLQPTWQTEQLHTDALTRFLNPGRLFLVYLNKGEDILWTMEEVLRSGAVPLVVADLPEPPGLTAVRRLHLAAETGSEEGKVAPLGLLLAPSTGGAAGVESRWGLTQAHAPDHLKWHLHRHRARREPQKSWIVEPKGRRFALKPFTGSDADVTL
jgi:protein ImuA